MKLPRARTENLIEQNLTNETLLYDLNIHKAFNLNETSTIVYKACDGITTFDELSHKYKFSEEFIYLALDELKRSNLLANESYVSPFAEVSRREIIKKVGLATMIALPIISGLVAPRAIDAASAGGIGSVIGKRCETAYYDCNNLTFCFSGLCCVQPSRGGLLVTSGAHYVNAPGSSPRYEPIPGTLSSTNCDHVITCCDGRDPIGSCDYELIADEPQPEGYNAYYEMCDCTCP